MITECNLTCMNLGELLITLFTVLQLKVLSFTRSVADKIWGTPYQMDLSGWKFSIITEHA